MLGIYSRARVKTVKTRGQVAATLTVVRLDERGKDNGK